MIVIDGSKGEGGGQVLRSALSLSVTTGQPFRIEKIRAKRSKPGLMRQHLTCVEAAASICGGFAEGAEIGATTVTFEPGDIQAGNYVFAVGTAGSCNLVFQTILPALLSAEAPSSLWLKGGTHNPAAPSYEVIAESYLPALAKMGVTVATELEGLGFYPAGGGAWQAIIQPAQDTLDPLVLEDRGNLVSVSAEAMVSNLPNSIAERELAVLCNKLKLKEDQLVLRGHRTPGPGNAVVVRVVHENMQEVFVAFGQQMVSAERVAGRLCQEVVRYLNSKAAVGQHLADQLLVPMALRGGGSFSMLPPSQHFETNCAVIEKFLDVEISCREVRRGYWRTTLKR